MSQINLFRLADGKAVELQSATSDLEKKLQTLIEQNLDALLRIRFLASEYFTGKTHSGRIDSLGLDENFCPVIIEYKRSISENVINQGLFYLDWLLDHKAEFARLVEDKLDRASADQIDWSAPRLICIASDFTRYDEYAVQQIDRNIDLLRYRLFGEELLLLETAAGSTPARNSSSRSPNRGAATKLGAQMASGLRQTDAEFIVQDGAETSSSEANRESRSKDKTYAECLQDLPENLRELLLTLEDYLLALGDDVQRKEWKLYTAFKRLKNFASVVLQKNKILLYLHLSPEGITLTPGKMRDMREIGHWGTGDIEIPLVTSADLENVKSLIQMAYEGRQLLQEAVAS